MVNGKVVNIPSYTLKPGDIVSVRERSKSLEVITDALSSNRHTKFSWLEWDKDSYTGKFMNIPERTEIPENIKEQLIVELYSK
jgi:small subunit ribosomal protein S4